MTIPGLIRFISYLLSALVLVSFVSFIWDEGDRASNNQIQIAADNQPLAPDTRDEHGRLTSHKRSSLRENVDTIADAATSPGESLGAALGGNPWALRGLAFIFGILVYLVALQALANWLEKSNVSSANRQFARDERDDHDDFTPGYR